MQKWEYRTVVYSLDRNEIMRVNGEEIWIETRKGPFNIMKHPSYYDYVKQLGEEGWEIMQTNNPQVFGATGITGMPSFIARRPIP